MTKTIIKSKFSEEKRIKLKNKSFTIKVELKNIIKRIYQDGNPTYSCDIWVNGKKSTAYIDIMFHDVKDLNDLYQQVIEKIGRL